MIRTALKLGVLAYIGQLAYKAVSWAIAGVVGTLLAAAVLGYFVFAVKSGWIVLG